MGRIGRSGAGTAWYLWSSPAGPVLRGLCAPPGNSAADSFPPNFRTWNMEPWDVVVVGGSNAAKCAALAAREGPTRSSKTWGAPHSTAATRTSLSFYFNYPGGSGLTNGSVFGRISGTNAACCAAAGL